MPEQESGLSELELLRKELRSVSHYKTETLNQKFQRKFTENPILPIGCLITVCAMGYGLWYTVGGRERVANHMMKLRVFAQGLTIASLVAGVMMGDKALGQVKGKR